MVNKLPTAYAHFGGENCEQVIFAFNFASRSVRLSVTDSSREARHSASRSVTSSDHAPVST